ncbi:MAG: hypothetical protein U1F34_01825 [Gammaproteobacteria bacterium]
MHEGSDVVVRCQDDGRGLDNAAIRQRAIAHGLIAENAVLTVPSSRASSSNPAFPLAMSLHDLGRGIGCRPSSPRLRELKDASKFSRSQDGLLCGSSSTRGNRCSASADY